jgi:hypothetical protein
MNLTNTPPLPMTEKCVECGKEFREGQVVASCPYLCGSLHLECQPSHNERLKHPEFFPIT